MLNKTDNMDFNFNFGSHYYESIGGSFWLDLFSSFLGFGFALFIYYLTNRKNKQVFVEKQRAEDENRMRYYRLLISSLIQKINKQIRSIDDYQIEQEVDFLNVTVPKQIVTNDFKRLVSINKEVFDAINGLMDSNRKDGWIVDLQKLHSQIDYVEGMCNELKRISFDHLEVCRNNGQYVKSLLDLIPQKLYSFINNLKVEDEDQYKETLSFAIANDAMGNYKRMVIEAANFDRINKEFLAPLINAILENKQEEDFEEVLFLAKGARVRMNDIINDGHNVEKEFLRIKDCLAESIQEIVQLNNDLKVIN